MTDFSRPIMLIVIVLALGSSAYAGPPKWKLDVYSRNIQDEPLRQVLSTFLRENGMKATLSAGVKDKVSGNFLEMESGQFFSQLMEAYNLEWYYDGSTMHISAKSENATQTFSGDAFTGKRLESHLKVRRQMDPGHTLDWVSSPGQIKVTGPPAFRKTAGALLKSFGGPASTDEATYVGEEFLQVFPLRHAWADDIRVGSGKNSLLVRGVASLVRETITGKGGAGAIGDFAGEESQKIASILDGVQREAESFAFGDGGQNVQPGIVADAHLNAVIVRDKKSKQKFYKALIQQLDVPVGLVEINASIFDISLQDGMEAGIRWYFKKSWENNVLDELELDQGLSGQSAEGLPQGVTISTILSKNAWQLTQAIRLLENEGKAKIRVRPAVTTFDNIAARIEQTESFHIRVSGVEVADVFPVETGLVLAVTPHIVVEAGVHKIMLAVEIQDGSLSAERSVEGIPTVNRSSITTQSLIDNEQSLFIGGLIHEESRETERRVPVLSRFPLIGWLFRDRIESKRKFERVFLITPRILSAGARDAGLMFELDDSEAADAEELMGKREKDGSRRQP